MKLNILKVNLNEVCWLNDWQLEVKDDYWEGSRWVRDCVICYKVRRESPITKTKIINCQVNQMPLRSRKNSEILEYYWKVNEPIIHHPIDANYSLEQVSDFFERCLLEDYGPRNQFGGPEFPYKW